MKPSEERSSGNSRSRWETHLGVERRDAWREEDEGGGDEVNKMAGGLEKSCCRPSGWPGPIEGCDDGENVFQ